MDKLSYDKLFDFEIGEDRMHYPIDGLDERYLINRKGGVLDTNFGRPLAPNFSNGKVYFTIKHKGEYISFPWNYLFLMAFSPMHIELETYKEKLKVREFDATVDSPNILNLCWVVPEGGVETKKYPGYYGIPNNSHLVVSKDLIFFSTVKNEIVVPTPPQTDRAYPRLAFPVELKELNPRVTSVVHRLVAFAFLPIKHSKADLYVNHINGIKTDFTLSNLEWVNHKENTDHAIATGLRNDNIPLFAYNLLTGEKKSFISYGECARFLGTVSGVVTGAVMHFRKNKSIKLKPWIITHQSDPVPRLQKNYLDNVAYSQNRFFKVTDKATQEVSYYFKAQDMLDKVGSSRKRMEKYPLRLKDFEINQYVVTDVQEADIPLEVLALKPTYVRGSKPQKRVRVTNLSNNSVVEYDSTDAFACVVGAQRKTIQRRALHNKGIWNGYRLEYLERNIKS